MANDRPEYLTVRELADLLRVKERKVYALAAAGEVPCSRATGKLLFPRAGIEAWLARHGDTAARAAVRRPEPPAVMVGSHDPLLEWALRESRSGIATFFDGSLDGLDRLARGEAIAAGLHLYDAAGEDWNRAQVEDALGGEPVVLLEWAWRERGLIVPAGNPKGLHALGDLRKARVVPRQPEAGSQVLFETLLARAGVAPDALHLIAPPARGETDVALAVADGKADAGFGLACMARQFRLDFVPLLMERFDLLVWRRAWFEPPLQRFVAFSATDTLAGKARELGGYDLSGLWRVRYNGP